MTFFVCMHECRRSAWISRVHAPTISCIFVRNHLPLVDALGWWLLLRRSNRKAMWWWISQSSMMIKFYYISSCNGSPTRHLSHTEDCWFSHVHTLHHTHIQTQLCPSSRQISNSPVGTNVQIVDAHLSITPNANSCADRRRRICPSHPTQMFQWWLPPFFGTTVIISLSTPKLQKTTFITPWLSTLHLIEILSASLHVPTTCIKTTTFRHRHLIVIIVVTAFIIVRHRLSLKTAVMMVI